MDILDFLQSQKIELGEVDSEGLKKDFYKNFKTVEEVNSKAEKLESATKQLEELQSQLESKGEELKGLEEKLESMESESNSKVSSLEEKLKGYELTNQIMDGGVKREHTDFVLFQVNKMKQDKGEDEFDFSTALGEVIKANPFLKEESVAKKTIPQGGSPKVDNSLNQQLHKAFAQ